MLIVELTIKRDDGATVLKMKGDALRPLSWTATIGSVVFDGPVGLANFEYNPEVVDRNSAFGRLKAKLEKQ